MPEIVFLLIIALLAILIILGTIVGVIIVIRRSDTEPASTDGQSFSTGGYTSEPGALDTPQSSSIPTPQEDIEAYMANQRAGLVDFELQDISNSFKGSTNEGRRQGVMLHLSQADAPIISFSSQVFNDHNGTINAETIYGTMVMVIAQGKASVEWNNDPLGVLEYTKQRILDPEGKLLGSIEHPTIRKIPADLYPISFMGQKAADVKANINIISTLRWLGGDDFERQPALVNLTQDLDDTQTLLLVAAVLLQVGFFDLL